MSYLVPNTILVSIFGYNLVNPYPEAIIASQKFALFENRYPQNKNNVSFGYPELHMSMHKFTSLILYVEYYSTKLFYCELENQHIMQEYVSIIRPTVLFHNGMVMDPYIFEYTGF